MVYAGFCWFSRFIPTQNISQLNVSHAFQASYPKLDIRSSIQVSRNLDARSKLRHNSKEKVINENWKLVTQYADLSILYAECLFRTNFNLYEYEV